MPIKPFTQPQIPPNKKKQTEVPPYYVDAKLEVKMYRGAGFERFPVVLGTVKGHQELCDKWDADQLRKVQKRAARLREASRTPYVVHGSGSESGDDSVKETMAALERKCLTSVRDIFPDISHDFVREKVQSGKDKVYEHDHTDGDVAPLMASTLAERIIAEILEMESYPKEQSPNSLAAGKAVADNGTGNTITWDRDLPKDKMYVKDGVILLSKTFVHVPTEFIHQVVEKKKSIFEAYAHIQDLEDHYYALSDRPYRRLQKPRTAVESGYRLMPGDRRHPREYANRINELQAAKQHAARREIEAAENKAKAEAETLNRARHIQAGATIECQCCFDLEVPLNRMVPCLGETPHFFCHTCVATFADIQVGLLKYEMKCMGVDGCISELSREYVGKAVPIGTFDRLELNRQQAEIMAAKIEGLEQCPFCNYKAICDSVDKEPVFECQNPDCCRSNCRKCHKDNHLPASCEDNARAKSLSARHLVEEARSAAVMRPCPKCGVKIIKDFGCNKMVCSGCGCILCYECKADLSTTRGNPYHHFNREGATCSLYDLEGVNRHEEEANKAETEAIKTAKAMNATLDERELRIETGQVKKPKLEDHPAADVFLRDLNNRAARLNDRQRHLQEMMAHVARLEALRPDPQLRAIMDQVRNRENALRGGRREPNNPPHLHRK